MNRYVVELEQGVWLAPWSGDPGRTMVLQSATLFGSEPDALRALTRARLLRPFERAAVVAVAVTAVQVVAVTDAHELPASPPPLSRVRALAVDPADWPDLGVSRVIPDAGSLGAVLLVEASAYPPRALVLLDDVLAIDCHCCSDGMPDLTCHWLPLSALEVAP